MIVIISKDFSTLSTFGCGKYKVLFRINTKKILKKSIQVFQTAAEAHMRGGYLQHAGSTLAV